MTATTTSGLPVETDHASGASMSASGVPAVQFTVCPVLCRPQSREKNGSFGTTSAAWRMKFGSAYATRGSLFNVWIVCAVVPGATETSAPRIGANLLVGFASASARTSACAEGDTPVWKPTRIDPAWARLPECPLAPLATLVTATATSAEARAAASRRRRAGRSRIGIRAHAPAAGSAKPCSERRRETPNRHPSRECPD